jgi:hypothetical protein
MKSVIIRIYGVFLMSRNLPEGYIITAEDKHYVKIERLTNFGERVLFLPVSFMPRFCQDECFRDLLIAVYMHTKPKQDRAYSDQEKRTGVVPVDIPFADSPYWYCPFPWGKTYENESIVKLSSRGWEFERYADCRLDITVPTELWDKFTKDTEWREKVFKKRTSIGYLKDYNTGEDLPLPEEYREKYEGNTGVIELGD